MSQQKNEKAQRAEGTTWRYAITREKDERGEDWFTIREVYTAQDGALSWTEDAIAARGDSWIDCADDLAIMGRAINAPVLDLTLDPPAFVSIRDVRRSPEGSALCSAFCDGHRGPGSLREWAECPICNPDDVSTSPGER